MKVRPTAGTLDQHTDDLLQLLVDSDLYHLDPQLLELIDRNRAVFISRLKCHGAVDDPAVTSIFKQLRDFRKTKTGDQSDETWRDALIEERIRSLALGSRVAVSHTRQVVREILRAARAEEKRKGSAIVRWFASKTKSLEKGRKQVKKSKNIQKHTAVS